MGSGQARVVMLQIEQGGDIFVDSHAVSQIAYLRGVVGGVICVNHFLQLEAVHAVHFN
jgi:hypothetical protein